MPLLSVRSILPLLSLAVPVAAGLGSAVPSAMASTPVVRPGASATQPSGPTGRLLVTVRTADGLRTDVVDELRDVAQRAGSRAVTTETPAEGTGGTAVVAAGNAAARARLTAKLEQDPRVVEVVPERRATVRSLPNDPVLQDQDPLAPSGITGAWWATKMRLPEAWALANGDGVKVAVIDTGFDLTHPQLKPIVHRAIKVTSGGELTGTARTDEIGHGTHVASLACSAFNDAAGTVGAGGRCRLITIKSDLYDSSVAKAITRATELGADVITMSFGVDGEPNAPRIIRDALEKAAKRGVILVAAGADNPTGEQGYPANVLQPTGTGSKLGQGIGLSVTAAGADGLRAGFAGLGSQISVAGYGAFATLGGPPGIIGAFPTDTVAYEQPTVAGDGTSSAPVAQRTELRGDRRYAYEAGTSMATPMVAGVAALVRDANPDLSSAQIIKAIKQSAGGTAGWDAQLGWGVVDGYAAVDRARRIDVRAPVTRMRTQSRRVSASRVRLSWTATDAAPRPMVASGVRRVEVWRSVDGRRFQRVATGASGRATVSVPPGRTRYVLRGVDRAGNRAALTSRNALVLRRG